MSIIPATKFVSLLSLLFIVNTASVYSSPLNLLLKTSEPTTTKTQEADQLQKETKIAVADEFNRGSPRSAIESYLDANRKGNYSEAIHYLDFTTVNQAIRKMPKEDVAKSLSLVLDRALWIDLPTLSDEYLGFVNDGIVGNRDLVGNITLGDKQIPFFIHQVSRDDGVMVWKIAGVSINFLPQLYKKYGDGPIGEVLTEFVPNVKIMGLLLWQWLTLLFMVIVGFIVVWAPTKFIADIIAKRSHVMSAQVAAILTGPIRMLVLLLLLRAYCPLMNLPPAIWKATQGNTLLIIAFTWTILAIINIFRNFFVARLLKEERQSVAKLLQPLTTMLKIIIVITAAVVWMENLGFDASAIVAGLGIGGLAFALAAQKSIENLIAAITLYVSAPVKIGNLCKIDKDLGFIEEIGLRYTKVRTLDRSLINISNAVFADLKLENYSERNRIRFKPELVLSYNSTKKQIDNVLSDIKKMLDEHENICDKPCRVRLANYLEHGYSISVMSYVDTTLFAVYAEVSNELNLAIIDILNNNKVKLADLNRGGFAIDQQDAQDSM